MSSTRQGTISGYYNVNDEIKFDKYKKRGAGYHWDQISRSITKRNIFVVARYNVASCLIK